MAQITKKQFADLCGIKTNQLAVYIGKEKRVVVGADELIDTDNELNAAFLKKWSAKARAQSVNLNDVLPPNDGNVEINPATGLPYPTYEESETKLKYLDTLKREKEVEKLQIEIDKKRGEVIPSDLIPPVITQHNQSIITAFKNEHEEWLRNFAKKHDMNINEVAETRASVVSWINTAMSKATDLTNMAVVNIVADYSEKRGIGERM